MVGQVRRRDESARVALVAVGGILACQAASNAGIAVWHGDPAGGVGEGEGMIGWTGADYWSDALL